ncbi:MAG TPA: lipopolysaccharide biosynthesis protein [Cyanobacteria bacterium UBA11369]|nr:lipopolysaccharide biosynthesis protein [Cyanobacteria bacterium UBA11371]HBE32476.1 lipopolysaccharide biosynthesis protein [Cyanobacteria bacterium UBA11368]HBE51956.1 lipopolysaccharide biosynthesis protein [Cyanobacteria bacterium UBA11369]
MESAESALGIQQYWLILKRRWLPASAVFVTVIALTGIKIWLQQPLYRAEAKLAFSKTNPTSSLTGLGKEIGEFSPVAEQTNPLNTEVEVIRSVPIAQQTITRLNLKDKKGHILKVRDFLKKLTVVNPRGTDIVTLSYETKDAQIAAAVVNTVVALYLDNNQRVNNNEATSAREFLEKQLPQATESVRQAETALRQFKEKNKVVDLQEEAKSAVATIANLQNQISQSQSELADAIAQSQAFQNQLQMNPQQGLVATSLSQSPAVQEAIAEYQKIERQLAVERTRFHDAHPAIADLKSKQATLKALLQNQVQQSAGNQQQLQNGSLQIGEVKPRLIEEFVKIEAKRQGLARQVTTLSNLKTAYQQRVNVLPRLEQEQRELENKLKVAQNTYSLMLQKFQEIRVAENQNAGNVRIIQPAIVPDEPVSARKALSAISGLLIGSLLSLATALILESRDKSIRTIEELREVLGLTLIGVIPDYKQPEKIFRFNKNLTLNYAQIPHYVTNNGQVKQNAYTTSNLELLMPKIVVQDRAYSSIATAYQMLVANLKFLCFAQGFKTLAVTSTQRQEGTSTVCANLAWTLAQSGRRVLLVDGNLHHPAQHEIWGLPNQVGLSNVILGDAELKSAIAEVSPNLKVLTSGVLPSNPMALLDSQQISALIQQFSHTYDLVIIDTPSLKVAADALILGQKADGIFLVVRPGIVDSQNAAFAKQLLDKSGQHVLGLVVNGVIPQNEPQSYYYFAQES